MPTTRFAGNPVASFMTQTIASSGLVIVMTNACGQCCLIAAPTSPTTLVLMPIRSSRLMPGVPGIKDLDIRPDFAGSHHVRDYDKSTGSRRSAAPANARVIGQHPLCRRNAFAELLCGGGTAACQILGFEIDPVAHPTGKK